MKNSPTMNSKVKKTIAAGSLVLAGVAGGAAVVASTSANAATDSGSSSSSSESKGHEGETPLTGTVASKVKAAALATYPGATVERLETDSDGTYEAHLATKDDKDVEVKVDKSFTVTGSEVHSGDHDGAGDGDGETNDGPDDAA